MRTRAEVSRDKLRGGFYSPDLLVDICLERSKELLTGCNDLRVLEPSAGNGAFLKGLHRSRLSRDVKHVEAVELLETEAVEADRVLGDLSLPGRVLNENILHWAHGQSATFDLVLANPPYVRFQFISEEDKHRARKISTELGVAGSSVSNLWISVFLLSLAKLREGGVFSVILPTEFLTGVSANAVRNWLLTNTTNLSIDLFQPGSFPAVLQEVLILSGRRLQHSARSSTITFHDHNGGTRTWKHKVAPGAGTWTGFLLPPVQYDALEAVAGISAFSQLGTVAKFSVSTVTGANSYFCVSSEEVREYLLHDWVLPLLPRSRHAQGLMFSKEEHEALAGQGEVAWLLHFSADRPSPTSRAKSSSYLDLGLRQNIDQRFKCRVREPWYRVPVVQPGDLLLSKRSNRYPRVIANHASVVTTDTIYKGQMLPGASITADDFTAVFHNSITMLSAEIEGRSFGGGVLELVPSEVSALQVPVIAGAGAEIARLDQLSRTSKDPDSLIETTDEILVKLLPELDSATMSELSEARHTLMARRLLRAQPKFYG